MPFRRLVTKVCRHCERIIYQPRPSLSRPVGTAYPVTWVECNICKPQKRWNANNAPLTFSTTS